MKKTPIQHLIDCDAIIQERFRLLGKCWRKTYPPWNTSTSGIYSLRGTEGGAIGLAEIFEVVVHSPQKNIIPQKHLYYDTRKTKYKRWDSTISSEEQPHVVPGLRDFTAIQSYNNLEYELSHLKDKQQQNENIRKKRLDGVFYINISLPLRVHNNVRYVLQSWRRRLKRMESEM